MEEINYWKRMKGWLGRLLLVVFALSVLFIWGGCSRVPPGSATVPTASAAQATSGSPSISNGQRIYNTSTSSSDESITYTGGQGMMMQGRLACVNCHGNDGHGGNVYFMMQNFSVPSITWPDLTAQGQDILPYSEETLKRAITQGIDSAGEPLKYPMPRWQMSGQDLNDLISFIKTLK